jgi:hypothetical protein
VLAGGDLAGGDLGQQLGLDLPGRDEAARPLARDLATHQR